LDDLIESNQEQIILFGGEHGILDLGLVDSALHNPRNLYEYGEDDLLVLAIRLGVGIARNHGFVDGNKRTGVVAMIELLRLNGYDLIMKNNRTLGRLFEATLVKKITEEDLAAMLYRRVRPIDE
jgi:death-on-curing protein